MVEISAALQDLRAGQQELSSRITQVEARINEVNARIDRLFFAVLGIGGGVMAALIAMLATLIVQGG